MRNSDLLPEMGPLLCHNAWDLLLQICHRRLFYHYDVIMANLLFGRFQIWDYDIVQTALQMTSLWSHNRLLWCHSHCDIMTGHLFGDKVQYMFGDKVQYMCNYGCCAQSGDLERHCLESFQWSGTIPTCSCTDSENKQTNLEQTDFIGTTIYMYSHYVMEINVRFDHMI